MATRAPSLSNSCAAASPIPLLPPVIRIFLSASLPMVVPPMMFSHLISFGGSNSSQHCPVIADPLVEAARRAAKYIPDGGGWGVHFSIPDASHVVAQHGLDERQGHAHGQHPHRQESARQPARLRSRRASCAAPRQWSGDSVP